MEVYNHMNLTPWDIAPERMMEEELRLEVELVRPIEATRLKVAILRQTGARVIFISDTPLPVSHLRRMLQNAGLAMAQDPIYASGELGLTKASGRLFDHVGNAEQPTDGWVHIGDHPYSDVAVPRAKGIEAFLFAGAALNRNERALARAAGGEPWERSLIAGVSRSVRLSNSNDSDEEELAALGDIVSGVVAPLLTCFVAWFLRDAVESGVERLYFVSRDGDLLLRIVSNLAETMPVPDCRYLYGSRRAWLFPAITRIDRDELDWLLDESPRLGDILAKLRLERAEMQDLLRAHGFAPCDIDRRLTDSELERFWALMEEPEVASRVLHQAERAREKTLAYLADEGLTSPGRWALVDVGWKLRSQQALRRLLETVGRGDSVAGYYLAVARRRAAMHDTGPYRAMAMPETDERVDTLVSHAMVIEEAFLSADHGSVVGYQWEEGRAAPVLGGWVGDPRRKAHLAKLRDVMSAFVREATAVGILDNDIEPLRDGALAATSAFLRTPTQAEATAVAWIAAIDDLSHEPTRARRLAVPLGAGDVVRRFAMRNLGRLNRVQRFRSEPPRYFWEEGSVALSPPWLRPLLRAASVVRLKTILYVPLQMMQRLRRTRSL